MEALKIDNEGLKGELKASQEKITSLEDELGEARLKVAKQLEGSRSPFNTDPKPMDLLEGLRQLEAAHDLRVCENNNGSSSIRAYA